MTDALQYIYYIFDKLLSWIFNDAEFFPNVTVGWVIITIILFGMVIRSLLNIPRGIKWPNNYKRDYSRDYSNKSYRKDS